MSKDVSITDLIAEARKAFRESAGWELGIRPGSELDLVRRLADALESVTVPTENERALAILTAHGFHDPKAVLEAVNTAIIEDRSFTTREGVSHELWSMGGWIKHKGCPNNPKHGNADAEYENGCKTCESYLLAVADALLATRLPVPVEEDKPRKFTLEQRADLIDFARSAIQSVWDDVGATTAEVLAGNVVSAQEFAWLSMHFPVAVPVEPEYEYGFSADGGPVVERAFGIVPFETADAARHTGSKWFEETLDIVRRTKATPAGEWEATQ